MNFELALNAPHENAHALFINNNNNNNTVTAGLVRGEDHCSVTCPLKSTSVSIQIRSVTAEVDCSGSVDWCGLQTATYNRYVH